MGALRQKRRELLRARKSYVPKRQGVVRRMV